MHHSEQEEREIFLFQMERVLIQLLEAIQKHKTNGEIKYYASFLAELLAKVARNKR